MFIRLKDNFYNVNHVRKITLRNDNIYITMDNDHFDKVNCNTEEIARETFEMLTLHVGQACLVGQE
jgi:hypothetical protein